MNAKGAQHQLSTTPITEPEPSVHIDITEMRPLIAELPQLANFATALKNPVVIDVVDYTTHQTHIRRIRQQVFVHEQNVPAEIEFDWLDPLCQHVLARWNSWVVGAGRLTPEGRISRVAVTKMLRRRGIGRQVMMALLAEAKHQKLHDVVISAQQHAIPFYEKLGFRCQGNPYEYVGISHITMYKFVD